MCQICILLDKAFPDAKNLARALFEVVENGDAHDIILYDKIIRSLDKQDEEYIEEFVEEGLRLSNL